MTGVMAASMLDQCAHKQLSSLRVKSGGLRQLDSDDDSNSSSDEVPDSSRLKDKAKDHITLTDMARMSYNGSIVDVGEGTGLPFMTIGWIFGTVASRMPELLQFRKDHRPRPKPAKEHKDHQRGLICKSERDYLKGRTQLSILMDALFAAVSKT